MSSDTIPRFPKNPYRTKQVPKPIPSTHSSVTTLNDVFSSLGGATWIRVSIRTTFTFPGDPGDGLDIHILIRHHASHVHTLPSHQARDPFSLCNLPKFKQFVCRVHLGHNHHHHPDPPREPPQLRHPPQPRQPIISTTTLYHLCLDHNRIGNKRDATEA